MKLINLNVGEESPAKDSMVDLAWTKELPAEEGSYWCRYNGPEASEEITELCELVVLDCTLMVRWLSRGPVRLSSLGFVPSWFGPLDISPPPEGPSAPQVEVHVGPPGTDTWSEAAPVEIIEGRHMRIETPQVKDVCAQPIDERDQMGGVDENNLVALKDRVDSLDGRLGRLEKICRGMGLMIRGAFDDGAVPAPIDV